MTETAAVSWAAAELGGANLGDARLNRRLVRVAERLGARPGASIPVACGGWAETQAAYRLLAHEAVRPCPTPGCSTSPTGHAIFTNSWSGRTGSPGSTG